MTTTDFLFHIRDLGINLWLDGDDLRYSAPKGALTDELRAELLARKAEVLAFLRETQPVTPPFQTGEAEPEPCEPHVAPRTPTEEMLARIWAEILGLERVGIYDNFFELGGDSLLSMQVITRANQAGLRFTPWQLLQHQTLAELAVVECTVQIQAEQGLVTGPCPLTCHQSWFLNQNFANPHRWNLGTLFEVHQALSPKLLEQVVRHILIHHDVLRARFICEESGWRQFIATPPEVVPFNYIDISELPPTDHRAAIEMAVDELQNSLRLEGPLFRAAYINLGTHLPGRLLVIFHHLVSEVGLSRPILLEDFQAACQQISRGEPIQLPAKTTSVKEWAERLSVYVKQSAELPSVLIWFGQLCSRN